MNKTLLSNNKIFIILNLVFAVVLYSCRLEVPVKEMAGAKLMISRAIEVKAERYAPEELKSAKENLLKSHDFIKDEKVDDAKKVAEESLKNANDAVDKSLPPLADDTLKEANKIFNEANNAFAEKYSPDEIKAAGEQLSAAEESFNDQNYWESYLKSSEAIVSATGARDKSLMNLESLNKKVAELQDETKKLESIRGRDIAPDEMNATDENLSQAGQFLQEKDLYQAYLKIIDAESSLNAAKIKIWKEIAGEKLKVAEDALNKAQASEYKDSFKTDIDKASSLIDESNNLYAQESYYESSRKSEEAIDVLNSLSIGLEKKKEEAGFEEKKAAVEKGGVESVKETEYTVKYDPKNRDCLWRIAMNIYKDAKLWPLIYVANRNQIKDPDLIFPGQKLVIPDIPQKTGSEEKEKADENNNDQTQKAVVPDKKEKSDEQQENQINKNTDSTDEQNDVEPSKEKEDKDNAKEPEQNPDNSINEETQSDI